MRVLPRLALTFLVPVSLLACGGEDGGGDGGDGAGGSGSATYAAKCEVACRPPEGPCGAEDPGACEKDCAAATEGLSAECAQCIAEGTGFQGTVCDGSSVCGFGPGDNACGGGSGDVCSPEDEQCSGYRIGEASSSSCAAVCGG